MASDFKELASLLIDPFNIVQNTANVFNDIWFFLLYNLITPIILLVFLVIFFVAQFYLFKAYVFVFKKVFTSISKVVTLLNLDKKGKQFINDFIVKFDFN